MRRSVLLSILLAALVWIVLAAPVLADCVYVVRPGDTLSAIARRYGVSLWTIARLNGLVDVNRIYVGQVLRIPCGGPPAPAPMPPYPPPPYWGYSYYPTAICMDGTVSYVWGNPWVCYGHGGVRAWVPFWAMGR